MATHITAESAARRTNGVSQTKRWASHRPDGTPSAAAKENAPITTPIPAARRSGGTTSLTTAITSVPDSPPKAPHRIRAANNAAWVCASAQANVPAVKPA